jgi:ketosteroid isomerase-like protein
VMSMGIDSLDMRVDEVEQHGDTAFEVSSATLHTADGQAADEIKYVVVWKREGGEWKLHRDIWNSSRPAQ